MKRAFTLLELIVVVIILGILISIALPTFRVSIEKSRSAEGIRILGDLRRSQIRYYTTYGTYASLPADPVDITVSNAKFFDYSPIGCGDFWGMTCVVAYTPRKINPESWSYILFITKDGNIYCNDSDAQSCAKIGFQRVTP